MSTKARTEKEIKAYKIRTVIFLIIILILTIIAIWQFLELQNKYKELRDKTNIIALKDSIIDQKAIIEKQKLEIDTAIMLLSILVSEEDGRAMSPEEVLKGLNNLAAKVRKEKAESRARRIDLIEKLFSTVEETRQAARRSLQREYSNDKVLTVRMLEAAESRIDMDNKESIYQIIYILEQMSLQSLQSYKSEIQAFFSKAEEALLIGELTKPRVDAILNRLEE